MGAEKGAFDTLLAMGLPGIVIIGLFLAVVKLFNLLMASHESRFTDGRLVTQTMVETGKQLDNLSDTIEKRLK